MAGEEGDPGTVPTFTMNRSTGEVSSFSPAASPRVRRSLSPWPPPRRHYSPEAESARPLLRVAARCGPARIRQVVAGGLA